MTRTMGDATHANAGTLAMVQGLELVAGYATGTPDVRWTAADWAAFPRDTLISIDQGANGSPVAGAIVRDVEPGAWTPAAAVDRSNWLPIRPTIYCDQSDLPAVLAAGWQGDLWLAIPGWQPGEPLPATPGCTVVAVQTSYLGAYDLSAVLDPTWPEAPMGTGSIIVWGPTNAYLLSGGRAHHISDNSEMLIYITLGVPGTSANSPRMTAAQETQFLADFPPGNPAVTVTITPG